MMRHLLRAIAVAIAVLGVVDPVLTLERPVLPAVTIAVAQQDAQVRHAASSLAWARALVLRAAIERDFRVSLRPYDAATRAAACPATGGCILVSDGPLPKRLSEGAMVIGALRVVEPGPRVAITGIDARRGARLEAASALEVQLEASDAAGIPGNRGNPTAPPLSYAIRLQVFDGHALVGAADRPVATAERSWTTSVPIEWVPLAAGPRRLRIVASLLNDGRVVSSHEAETAVDVQDEPARVLLYEPEATWIGTFVRRAIEGDRRFRVEARTQVAPGIAVSKGAPAALRAETLDAAAVVVVSAPERLTASDVDLLERYARVRGGSVVLLPVAEPSGPIARLVPPVDRTFHELEPQTIGLLRSRDVVAFRPSPEITALASLGERPVIVARAAGRGRVIVSGAIDAWRYREAGGFARFWSSVIADAARATGSPVEAEISPRLLKSGEESTLHVEWRTLADIGPGVSAEALLDCGEEHRSIRLWPAARIGSFTGTVPGLRPGTCVVTAAIDGSRFLTRTSVLAASDVKRPVPGARVFADTIAARGGSVEEPGHEDRLAARARELLRPAHAPQEVRPMQSPWWIVPFAACLCAEWALRRRAGER